MPVTWLLTYACAMQIKPCNFTFKAQYDLNFFFFGIIILEQMFWSSYSFPNEFTPASKFLLKPLGIHVK